MILKGCRLVEVEEGVWLQIVLGLSEDLIAMPSWLKALIGILGTVLGGGFAFYLIINNSCNSPSTVIHQSGAPPAPSNPPSNGSWTEFPISGEDGEGRRADFIVEVLAQEDRWKLRETDQLDSGPVERVLPPYLNRLEKLVKAKGVIVVGTASQEGGLLSEEGRADRRADQLLKLVKPLVGLKKIYKLNLGQHSKDQAVVASDTSYQRRVIIVGIMQSDPSMNVTDLRTALFNALSQESKYSFDAVKYSKFVLEEV